MTFDNGIKRKLGLIGVGISRSNAPNLHRLAGQISGIAITYDLIQLESEVPAAFDEALGACSSQGYCGINVTHPFKKRAAEVVPALSEQVRRLGAVNTVRFDAAAEPQGFNTDYTGFKRAFQSRFAGQAPGTAAIIGAGGAGRAISFGLADLGATEIRLFDLDLSKSEGLATALRAQSEARIVICKSLEEATANTDGLVNATPVGMHQHPGTAIPKELIGAQSWAFDAVYTPRKTRFLMNALDAGIEVLDGYELFFYQGVDAFEIFTGVCVDEVRLREALAT